MQNMNETEDSIKKELSDIESQLRQLEQLEQLSALTDDLQKLKADLKELYSLKEAQLLDVKKNALMAIVQEIEEKDVADEEEAVNESLGESLIGQSCSVPSWSSSGFMHFQNCVICGVDPARGRVKVLIAAPTHPCDLPCPKFLNGDDDMEDVCGVSGASCSRSHGRFVAIDELGEYQPPDWSTMRPGHHCLVKLDQRQLWLHATVEGMEDEGRATVCLRHAVDANGDKVISVPLEKVLPMTTQKEEEEGTESSSDGEDEEDDDDDREEAECGPRSVSEPSGPAWEAHSRGIASKIMAAMGFQPGQGLGSRSQGRVEPVPIEVLPAGASLDRVMQLRERRRAREMGAAGKGISSTASSGKRRQGKKGVFNFLNSALSGSSSSTTKSSSLSRKSLDKSSQQEVGRQLLEKEKVVETLEKKISRLKSLLSRTGDHQGTQTELGRLQRELEKAKGHVKLIERHRAEKRDKQKLSIF